MLRLSTFFPALIGPVLLLAPAWADTVVLKNGEKIQGTVLSETDAEVTLKVQVTPTITDERVIKMADIETIEKEMPDEAAWTALENLAPGEESLDPADYRRVQAALEGFIASHPKSRHVNAAKEKLAAFQAEAKRVEGGELKIGGKWLTREEVERERVQIAGRIALSRMKRHAAAGQLVEAMNVFAAIEKNAAGSAAYPDAVELAAQVIPLLKTAAEQRRAQWKAKAEEDKRRLAAVQGAEKQQLELLLKNQAAAAEATVASYERAGALWMPLSPATDRSLASLASRASAELSRIQRADVAKMRTSIALSESARTALAAKDIEKADKEIREAISAWPANELAKRLQTQLTEARKADMDAKAAEARAAAEAASAAAKATPPPKPKPTPQPAEAAPPVVEEPVQKEEPSPLSKPVFWVSLIILGGLVFAVRKFLGKFSDPMKNILDQ